jgi:formate hydrogenlyase subunit 6/NADH:ubiquinone oxidoreductase subunit I
LAHHALKSAYERLSDRLNRFPQGAPPTELLFKILKMLFTEQEAQLMAQLPIKPFTAQKAARIWKMNFSEAQKVLDQLAAKALLVDIAYNGTSLYVLPPPMAGFFEFSMMRIRKDIDQKLLSTLFYEYLNVEEDFIRALFTDGETQLGRTFVHEPVLSNDAALYVLDYERASHVITSASHIGVSMCYCRHKMQHLDRACDAPMNICMTFNNTADSLTRHGHARRVDASECMDLLHLAYDHNLLQFGENVQRRVNFICNCCGCCCEALLAARRFAILNPVHTTNFIPKINTENCNGCGRCVSACPVEAMTLVSANDPSRHKAKQAKLDEQMCLGCGLCVRACTKDAISLQQRPERVITPVNGSHRIVLMAVERGKLQHLIFDNRVLWNHRALAALLGVILKLPPMKQVMASRQMKSRYLEWLISKTRH